MTVVFVLRQPQISELSQPRHVKRNICCFQSQEFIHRALLTRVWIGIHVHCSCSRFSTHSWRSEKFLSPVFRPGNIYCQVPAPTNNDCDCVCQAPGHSPTSPALPGPGCWVTPYPWCIAATPGNNIISSDLDLIKENWTNTQSVRNRIFTMDDLPIKPGYNSDFLFLYSPCSHLIGLFVVDVEVSGLDIDQCDATQSPEVIISSSILKQQILTFNLSSGYQEGWWEEHNHQLPGNSQVPQHQPGRLYYCTFHLYSF